MTRYHLFHRLHKGLRALLFDTGLLFQRTDFTIEEEAGEALDRLRLVIKIYDDYCRWHYRYVLPALTAYEPGIAVDFEQGYHEAGLAAKKLEAALKKLSPATQPAEAINLCAGIESGFTAFTRSMIPLLDREERVVNRIMWQYYSDTELEEIAWRLISDPSSGSLSPYAEWIARGLNHNEMLGWLREARHTMDRNRFVLLVKLAEAERQPRHWRRLKEALFPTALVA